MFDANLKLTKEEAEELNALLLDRDMSVAVFAVTEAKVHHQTVYNALRQEKLQRKSFSRIKKALDRLRTGPTKSKAG